MDRQTEKRNVVDALTSHNAASAVLNLQFSQFPSEILASSFTNGLLHIMREL